MPFDMTRAEARAEAETEDDAPRAAAQDAPGDTVAPETTGRGSLFGDHEDPAFDDASDGVSGTSGAGARPIAPGRGELVGLALQIDTMIARSDEMGLELVAYMLSVARAEIGDRLGERRAPPRARPSAGEGTTDDAGEGDAGTARAGNDDARLNDSWTDDAWDGDARQGDTAA